VSPDPADDPVHPPMSYVGTIVSHDRSLHTGLVLPDNSPEAISFTEGDVLNWDHVTPLVGERAVFEIVQVAQGYAAIQMLLPPRKVKQPYIPQTVTQLLVPPLLVLVAAYALHLWLFWPLIISYFICINFIGLVLLMLIAAGQYSSGVRPAEFTAVLLAFLGGAPVMTFGAYLLPTRFQTEVAVVFLVGLSVCQGLFLNAFFPEFFELSIWSRLV